MLVIRNFSILFTLLIGFSFSVHSQEADLADRLKTFCEAQHSYQVKYLKNFALAAQAIRNNHCSIDPVVADVRDALVLALIGSSAEFSSIDDKPILKGNGIFDTGLFQAVLANTPISSGLPTFNVQRVGVNDLDLNMGNTLRQQVDMSKCDATLQTQYPTGTCVEFFNEYKALYNFAHMTVSSPVAKKVWDVWDKAESDWNRYFDEGRSQMPWEYLANYSLWARTKQAGRVGTPLDYQLILLHPSIVIENVSDALDGDNTKEGLMIEVLGVNFWRSDNWYEPTGASIVSVYADRAQTRDWGWGLAVHFDNNFTVGATRRDDENGFFISVDLWQAFMDKKSKLKDVRDRVLGD